MGDHGEDGDAGGRVARLDQTERPRTPTERMTSCTSRGPTAGTSASVVHLPGSLFQETYRTPSTQNKSGIIVIIPTLDPTFGAAYKNSINTVDTRMKIDENKIVALIRVRLWPTA